MRIPTIVIIFIYALGLVSCSADQVNTKSTATLVSNQLKKSRVINFHYDGYSDTICALVYGNVYEIAPHKSDSLKGLQDVTVKVDQTGETVTTNNKGDFVMGFKKGIYSLTITKLDFQTLKVTNYLSDPDQISMTKIVLEKGDQHQIYKIPGRPKE